MIERKKEFMSASSFDRFQCSCNRSILLLQQQQQQNKNVQIESYPEQSPPHVLSTSYSQLQINSLQLCSNLKVESDRPSQTLHSSTQPPPSPPSQQPSQQPPQTLHNSNMSICKLTPSSPPCCSDSLLIRSPPRVVNGSLFAAISRGRER
ncbi:hypothetical protein SISNIDRAFT_123009 [Sistotremastrum niveocremeum HHB9708]|uniref:Uncharacterized protein n=1 Tax=Sistotremastrum niveocremeum HHB9708 TaxID=1314777 RepID=A0A164T5F8_9AGAM|nr:hypothetical protein SISNIDRAFT_123009 [Sistotremastrum niveocremeum HHB9708]